MELKKKNLVTVNASKGLKKKDTSYWNFQIYQFDLTNGKSIKYRT